MVYRMLFGRGLRQFDFEVDRVRQDFKLHELLASQTQIFLLLNKLRRSNDIENEIGTSLAGIPRVTASSDIGKELDFVAKIDSLVDPSLGGGSELGENELKGFVSYDSARYKWHHRYQMQITLNI